MHQLLENAMVGRRIPQFADEKLQEEIAALPLSVLYIEESNGMLVVGMNRDSNGDRERHEQTLDRLSRFVGSEPGVAHRLTYLNVFRDFNRIPSRGSMWDAWNAWDDGDDGSNKRKDQRQLKLLRGGLSLGCAGTLCLVYSLGRGRQAAIVSGHAVGSASDARIFFPEALYTSKSAKSANASSASGDLDRDSVEDAIDCIDAIDGWMVDGVASEVVAVITANPSLQLRASDSALALLTNHRIAGRDHSIWQADDREYHITKYVSSIETPLTTQVSMQSGRGGVGTGSIRHKGCSIRDAFGALTDQVLADYEAKSGDSGAPVFVAGRGVDEVGFVGIHAGRIVEESGRSFSFYSTWEAIKLELQLPAPRW